MFDETQGPRRTVAIIGGGISGLAAAYELSASCKVTLFEAEPRLGGHARTRIAGLNGDQPVDTGFIVFNYVTYPHLTRLFRELDVPVAKSQMSFAASIGDGRLEYSLQSLGAAFAQRRNLLNPRFHGMIADILRFGARAEDAARDDSMTIGELSCELRLGRWFRDFYLRPICGAIWSMPEAETDRFPARALVRFFRNHGLLARKDQHQWWTVEGGSVEYVRRLQAALVARGCEIVAGRPVAHVGRETDSVRVAVQGQGTRAFDDVVFACHSDQALALLGQGATAKERAALGAIRYQKNVAVLHRDAGQMPRRRECWASWNYRAQPGSVGITYWMNRLQNIPESDPLFVTLNPATEIDERLIYDRTEFAHPVFDQAALKAQGWLQALQGDNRSWYAGAYHRNGFHEDGIASAMRVVRGMKAQQFAGGMDAAFG